MKMPAKHDDLRDILNLVPRLRFIKKYKNVRLISISSVSQLLRAIKYVFTDAEIDTFTYDILNLDEVLLLIGRKFGVDVHKIFEIAEELLRDELLSQRLRKETRKNFLRMKVGPRLGRHVVLYVLIRVFRPDVVVELGVKDGLGTAVYAKAIEMNQCGSLLGVDINPRAGKLSPVPIIVGESTQILEKIAKFWKRGIVISDSLRDSAYIIRECQLAKALIRDSLLFVHNLDWVDLVSHGEVPMGQNSFKVKICTDHLIEQKNTRVINDVGRHPIFPDV